MTDQHRLDQHGRRTPRRGRARKRAIRAHAAQAGVAYSVAARQLEAAGLRPGETIASYGRTVYPPAELREARERRPFEQRRDDARRAGLIPDGRARHLVERFPPARGRPGSRVGPLYAGARLAELLSLVYAAVAAGSPRLVPEVGDLAWTAEMGEETAVDMVCAELDWAARELLEGDPAGLLVPAERVASAERLTPGERLVPVERAVPAPPFDGVRQILDAVLVVAHDGHAPGTRVRMLGAPHENRIATIVGAVWGAPGPPVAYQVQVEGALVASAPGELVVLAGQ